MRIDRAEVIGYGGATPGVRSATSPLAERSGLLLRIHTRDGLVGQGEASPLPGYSQETMGDARAELERFDWDWLPEIRPGKNCAEELLDWIDASGGAGCSSARFAVETALLDVLGQRAGKPIWALLNPSLPNPEPVPFSVYLGGADDPAIVDAARAAAARGAHTVKVKIRGPVLGAQLDVLRAVRDAIGSRPLRLDANRSFEPTAVNQELERLGAIAPEFVEEPVPAADLPFVWAPPFPIVFDESLQDPKDWPLIEPHVLRLHCAAAVLKPMALGGFSGAFGVGARAVTWALDAIVSHLFDGPVALAAATHFALAWASRTRASGLGEHAGLAAWPVTSIPWIEATRAIAPVAPGLGLPILAEPG